jgi:hypothetical protein
VVTELHHRQPGELALRGQGRGELGISGEPEEGGQFAVGQGSEQIDDGVPVRRILQRVRAGADVRAVLGIHAWKGIEQVTGYAVGVHG